ncbi:hypothetical protein [Streptomyces sp. CAU 1734]|uniref:hypothetical protein n=1 Tax=Streptomyces sp. CAU 1734 TaxID=3140360 RepID=UPI003261CBFF
MQPDITKWFDHDVRTRAVNDTAAPSPAADTGTRLNGQGSKLRRVSGGGTTARRPHPPQRQRHYIDASAYGITRNRAREAALTLDEHTLELAERPYDLRHAGISFWLASGVDPAECARRAGQSIQVSFRHYAKFLAETRDHADRLIEASTRRWEGASETDKGELRATGPGIPRNSWSEVGYRWEGSGVKLNFDSLLRSASQRAPVRENPWSGALIDA